MLRGTKRNGPLGSPALVEEGWAQTSDGGKRQGEESKDGVKQSWRNDSRSRVMERMSNL